MKFIDVYKPRPLISLFARIFQCEKLAILRQRLVARRQKRLVMGNEGSIVKYSQDGLGLLDVRNPIEDDYQSGERHDADDYSAKLSTSNSTFRNNDKQDSIQTMHDPDNANDTQSHNSQVEGDPDDEASVVDITLIQCDCCKRSFAPKIYEKHFDSDGTPKCATASDKKRAVFDSAKVP